MEAAAGGARAEAAAAAELPVFCLSARDAQKLEGRSRRDGGVSAFSRLEWTEVGPGLGRCLSSAEQFPCPGPEQSPAPIPHLIRSFTGAGASAA